jgi:tripartite-type tricarboxylate transporter receptor subunit TctC
MNKFLIATVLSLSSSIAIAQKVTIPVPFSAGGHFSSLVPATAEALKKKGWDVDVQFVGKCGVAKETFEKSNDAVLTVWATNWLKSKDNTCFVDIDENNFVDIYMQAPNYFCGPVNQPNWTPEKGKTYRVGVTNSISEGELNAISEFGKTLGVEFKPVTYTNSGNVRTAHTSKEVDTIFSSIGLEQQATQNSKCIATSATKPVDKIPTIWSITKLNPEPIWVGFLMTNNKGLTSKQYLKLKNDVREIISNNEAISKYMKTKHLLGYPGPLSEQFNFVMDQTK